MAVPNYIVRSIFERLLKGKDADEFASRFVPRRPRDHPLPPRLPPMNDYSEEALARRRDALEALGIDTAELANPSVLHPQDLAANIENYVGVVSVPVGVAGPLRINGANAFGDFYVPMATTEGALIASYTRGSHVISQAGGASVVCLTESVSRAPCFTFTNLIEAGLFLSQVLQLYDSFQEVVRRGSKHCQLVDMKTVVNGQEVYLVFEFTTGDASGQNMVTLAAERICQHIIERTTITPKRWYIEGNMSGDKKATTLSFTYARGKKVVADVTLPAKIVRRFLGTDPESMFHYWQVSFMGGTQSGSIGSQGHFANALAAIFIACGQDAACVSEASVGITRMSVTDEGDLYVAVSLPNLIVGTVGGGTNLPHARNCLQMIDCHGAGKAEKFAEVCAVAAMAGEISIIGALAAGDFAKAHANYGRAKT